LQQNLILSYRLLIFLFTLLCLPLCSQQYSLTHYNTDNGLPQNSVKDIIKDKYGFIWLTTENGVVRYDGSAFLTFKDFPINNQRFTFFYGNIQKDSILTGAGYHTILLHRRTAKVFKDSRPSGIRYEYGRYQKPSTVSYNYHPNQGGAFYLALKEGRYFISDSSITYEQPLSLKATSLRLKTVFKKRNAVFTLNEKLYYINYATGKVCRITNGKITASYDIPLLTDKNSSILWSQINNAVFIVRDKKIYSLSHRKGYFRIDRLAELGNISTQHLTCAFYDKTYDKLYLGSSIEGLKVLSFHQFFSTKEQDGNHTVFYSTLPYDHASVITPKGQIYSRNGLLADRAFDTDSQYFVSYDPDHNLMVQDSGKLYGYLKSSSFTTRRLIAENPNIFVDFLYDRQRYYAITRPLSRQYSGGQLVIYKDRSFSIAEKTIALEAEPTRLFMANGFLWVGTIRGMIRISLKTYRKENIGPYEDIYIRNIVMSNDGRLWITTLGKGFYLLKDDKLIKMPLDADKNLLSAHTILEDQNHFFWIPTNNGLYKVRERKLLEAADGKKNEVSYYRFTKDAGFNTNEFNGGSNICGNRLTNGDFVLPSLDGLVFFNPLKTKSRYPVDFYLERALIDGKEISFSESLTVDQEVQKIDIFVDVPYFANRNNVMIRLSRGPGKKWENIEQGMKVTLFNPSYGDYVYTLKILTSDNGNYLCKKIRIRVTPYFYQTVWFQSAGLLLLALLIIFIIKIRTRILKNKNLMLEDIIEARTQKLSAAIENLEKTKSQLNNEIGQQKKLIGTITHDITTPIKFIAFAAQDILENGEHDEEKLRRILTSISKSSGQLYNFTLALKEYADIYNHHRSDQKERYRLYDLIEEKKELFDPIAGDRNTVIDNSVDPDIYLDINKNTLSVIIHNLLDNAVKFTTDGHIRIESGMRETSAVVVIKDNGMGMSPSQMEYYTSLHRNMDDKKLLLQKYGMGLHLVLQLIHILDGKIELESNTPSGTVFRIIIKSITDA
jgi:signal transduction histidine kinase